MANMEELLNQMSVEITRDRTAQLFISKMDLDYAYGQMKISKGTSRQCVFAITVAKFSGYFQFKKGLRNRRNTHKKKIRKLEYCTSWLDDIMVVKRGDRQEHEKKLFNVLNKLEKAGYRASKRKSEFFMKQTKWLGHEIDENGMKPNEEKVEAIKWKLKSPNNTKELKSFLGAIQYLAKFLPKRSETTDRLRKLPKKNGPWKGEKDQEEDFMQLKRMLNENHAWVIMQKTKKIWTQRRQVKPDSELRFGRNKTAET